MNPNQEDGRADVRYDLGITVHESGNFRRKHSRSSECAKMGLNVLLLALVACGWANFFNLALTPLTGGIAILYALAVIITPNESPKEL